MPNSVLIFALGAGIALFIGLAAGAGVAAMCARLALGRPLIGLPRCVLTGRRLPWADALPVIRFLRRGGRCRGCGRQLPRWWTLTEAAMGLLALLAFFSAGGLNVRFAIYLLDLAVLTALLIMDWRRHEIYATVLIAGALAGLLGGLLLPEIGLSRVIGGLFVGGGFMLVLFGLGRLLGRLFFGRDGLAWGDVELAAVLGAIAGFPGVITPLVAGPLLGVMLFMRRGLGSYFPFAPGLCIAAMLVVLAHSGPTPFEEVLRNTQHALRAIGALTR